jgi:NadR type nicotinamide-nucleotide adenylyltransferase
MKYERGLVIGKFLPPHRGHQLLIDTATDCSTHVTVIVCERDSDEILGEQRAGWLREMHPSAQVRVVEDRYDPDDSRVWAENTLRWLGRPPDAVFTSEDYGERYAGLMGSHHVLVDRERVRVPCSARAIRRDPYAHWDFIEPPVRGWYAKRVCVVGAESTGTTTLARDLAERLQTVWVPEYGREYCEPKFARGEATWHSDELVHIATEQTRREDLASRQANRVLVCDTNAFATVLWHRRYVGRDDPRVQAIAARAQCDLYLLTGDEIAFVQDGLRDGEAIRHQMHGWFEEALAGQATPWLLVTGSPSDRLRTAEKAVRRLFSSSAWTPPPAPPRA